MKEGEQEEQKQQVAKTVVKLDAVLGRMLQAPRPHAVAWKYPVSVADLTARTLVPLTPPPRAA